MKSYLCFLFCLLLCACAQRTQTTTFQIKTLDSANQNAPFYVIFKSTDLPHFLTDDYKKVAHAEMIAKEDPNCLESVLFVPGETKTITIKNPQNKAIGVYFIFTHPEEEWKYIAHPDESRKIKMLIGESEIKNVNAF